MWDKYLSGLIAVTDEILWEWKERDKVNTYPDKFYNFFCDM